MAVTGLALIFSVPRRTNKRIAEGKITAADGASSIRTMKRTGQVLITAAAITAAIHFFE
jgi:hypothetical protein